MKELRILFTGVGRRVELVQTFKRAALNLGKNVKIYGADITGTAPGLTYCDFTRKVVRIKEGGYIANLLEICEKDKINLVIPTIDTDLLILAENKAEFEKIGTRVLVSSPDMIGICRDKNLTSQFFVDCGLHAPLPVNDWKEYKDRFPAFIKPKDGSSSINAYKVENEKQLEVYAGQIEDYIVQPFVDGREFTIDAFCDFDGNPISIVPRERVQVRAGEVLKTQITLDPVMVEECKQLCSKFKPCGPITIQLIRDHVTGDNYYIEINPRFGGGAPLSMKAGGRSAEYLIRLLDGEANVTNEFVQDGAIYSRFDQSVCIEDGNGVVKGVIFDLDDTLYLEKDYVKSGYRAVAEYLGDTSYTVRLTEFFAENKPAIDCLLEEIGRTEEKAKALEVYREHMPKIKLTDGARDLLIKLRKSGIKIGIITDGRPSGQRNKIAALGLEELVDDIIVTDELGGPQFRKPCDIAFRIMQTKWKLYADEMVYIGDNPPKDVPAPKQLGMKVIWFNNIYGIYAQPSVRISKIMKVVTSFEELEEALYEEII